MIDNQFALQFAADWINSWNKQDLDTLMAHYTENLKCVPYLTPERTHMCVN
jgi:ketosteroid isomerase-like protein